MHKRTLLLGTGAGLGLSLAGFPRRALAQAVAVDPALAVYRPVAGISGSLKSIGSDTLNNLMTLWAEGFQQIYPNGRLEIEGKGSSTAPPALVAGTSQFGPMSRPMNSARSTPSSRNSAIRRRPSVARSMRWQCMSTRTTRFRR